MVDYGLKDRVALITGANNPQGIGATTAFAFAREGQRLFWSIRESQGPLTRQRLTGMELTDTSRPMQEMPMS